MQTGRECSRSRDTGYRPESRRSGKVAYSTDPGRGLRFLNLVSAGGWGRSDGHPGMIMILIFGFLGTHTEVEISVQEVLLGSVPEACICGGKKGNSVWQRAKTNCNSLIRSLSQHSEAEMTLQSCSQLRVKGPITPLHWASSPRKVTWVWAGALFGRGNLYRVLMDEAVPWDRPWSSGW